MQQRSRALTTALTLALGAAACGDGTASRQTIVAVTLVEQLGPTVTQQPDGSSLITCEVELNATATGQGAATWVDATFRVFATSNPSTPFSTTTVTADFLHQAWGAEQIFAGETQTSRWGGESSFPFSAQMDFRYRASRGGPVLTSAVSFTCSP